MSNIVKNPYGYRDLIMNYNLDRQRRICGEAIRQYCQTMHITYKDLERLVDPYARKFGCRFTYSDIMNYVHRRVSPKSEKMAALARATHVPDSYWKGYVNVTVRQPKKAA